MVYGNLNMSVITLKVDRLNYTTTKTGGEIICLIRIYLKHKNTEILKGKDMSCKL